MTINKALRRLPSVEKVLNASEARSLIEKYGRSLSLDAIRHAIEETRQGILSGALGTPVDGLESEILKKAAARLELIHSARLKKVINCSGVIIHTNLGRSILAEEAAEAAHSAALSNTNLEYSLDEGARGDRDNIVEDLITKVTGAEAATVVNNNAAAVLLALNTLSDAKETIVSRGELIEIGGSFRLPEIMSKSGCILREVGTTNRTHMADYENAVGENTGLILHAHTSNYRIVGFTSNPSLTELSAFARSKNLPLMVDLGSGTLIDLAFFCLPHEPTVQETLAQGADIVTISGDKLLGGPQAGIITGKKDIIQRIKANHLKRALRLDKITLAALEATLRIYLNPEEAVRKIPSLRYLSREISEIQAVAEDVRKVLQNHFGEKANVSVMDDISRAGSGSLPEIDIPSVSVAVNRKDMSPDETAAWFRKLNPPVIGRIENGLFRLDMRCVDDASVIGQSLPSS